MSEQRTNVYEAMVIFDSNRYARERAGLSAELEKMIQAEQGEVLVSRLWEERRLAYVGVTRAQDHLTLTRAAARRKWGKLRPSLPSRFLFEMKEAAAAEEKST